MSGLIAPLHPIGLVLILVVVLLASIAFAVSELRARPTRQDRRTVDERERALSADARRSLGAGRWL